ncbi:hypothetical protein DMUE_0176 [Dictyocoela muelleri]|nr:hypothetical protein DMUE_0176 [Dictyocoela muelleri]
MKNNDTNMNVNSINEKKQKFSIVYITGIPRCKIWVLKNFIQENTSIDKKHIKNIHFISDEICELILDTFVSDSLKGKLNLIKAKPIFYNPFKDSENIKLTKDRFLEISIRNKSNFNVLSKFCEKLSKIENFTAFSEYLCWHENRKFLDNDNIKHDSSYIFSLIFLNINGFTALKKNLLFSSSYLKDIDLICLVETWTDSYDIPENWNIAYTKPGKKVLNRYRLGKEC